MGGNALKHTGVRRYQNDEFRKLAKVLVPKVAEVLETEASLVISYRNKESHGDMDILVLNDGSKPFGELYELIEENFSPTDIVKNGNCWSFDYQQLQIDLILTPPENWETTKVFYSYNDLGNLMGKIFHKFGLKYGFDGVKYVVRNEDKSRKIGTIIVTKDMRKAFEFIGLSFDRYEEGFDELTEIYDYVINSPYFTAEAFYFENLNAINKKRNRNRAVYNQFIKYVENIKTEMVWETKSFYFETICKAFPEANLASEVERLKDEGKKVGKRKGCFNAGFIMKHHPELKGIELGKVFEDFKKYSIAASGLSWEEFIDKKVEDGTCDQLIEAFSYWYKSC